jgi:hypothetical protein
MLLKKILKDCCDHRIHDSSSLILKCLFSFRLHQILSVILKNNLNRFWYFYHGTNQCFFLGLFWVIAKIVVVIHRKI